MYWDEYRASAKHSSERWAISDRGWLFDRKHKLGEGQPVSSLGNYLDYGPDHYRSSHEYCGGVCKCRVSQPGNIHCVVYAGNSTRTQYVETIKQAREWIEASANEVFAR